MKINYLLYMTISILFGQSILGMTDEQRRDMISIAAQPLYNRLRTSPFNDSQKPLEPSCIYPDLAMYNNSEKPTTTINDDVARLVATLQAVQLPAQALLELKVIPQPLDESPSTNKRLLELKQKFSGITTKVTISRDAPQSYNLLELLAQSGHHTALEQLIDACTIQKPADEDELQTHLAKAASDKNFRLIYIPQLLNRKVVSTLAVVTLGLYSIQYANPYLLKTTVLATVISGIVAASAKRPAIRIVPNHHLYGHVDYSPETSNPFVTK